VWPWSEGRVDAERVQGVVHCGEHAGGGRVRRLEVERLLAVAGLQGMPDQRRLADAAAAGDLDEEPPVAGEDAGEVVRFGLPSVEAPVHLGSLLRME
jgi:hypothetical protein